MGFVGDEHGDSVHHGGPEKAVLHYPLDHYDAWKRDNPAFGALLERPGAFGENISSRALTEKDVCIGDTLRLGSALVQVSQPRRPCWRLNVRFGYAQMAGEVRQTGRCGWYYRVIETGTVKEGDSIFLEQRPNPQWSLVRICRALYAHSPDLVEVAQIVGLPYLAESLRNALTRRLESAISGRT